MLRTYDYECECGVAEMTVEYDVRDEQACAGCGQDAQRLMCAPAVHTLETRMRGYRNDNSEDKESGQGYWNPGFGEFIDENLTDPATGEPMRYSSLKEKERCLERAGKFELGDNNKGKSTVFNHKRRGDKPIIFTKEGGKGTTSRV